jgi:mRNA interferase MazF
VATRNQVTVAVITRTARGLRSEVALTRSRDSMPKDCVVNLDVIQTMRKNRLTKKITTLTPARMAEVDAALKFALELS